MAQHSVGVIHIRCQLFGKRVAGCFLRPVRIPGDDCLVGHRGAKLFIAELVKSGRGSSMAAQRRGGRAVCASSTKRQVIVGGRGNCISCAGCTGRVTRTERHDLCSDLGLSFSQLGLLSITLSSIHCSRFSFRDGGTACHDCVGNFPVVSTSRCNSCRIRVASDKGRRLIFSLCALRIPIPTSSGTIRLPGASSIVRDLGRDKVSVRGVGGIRVKCHRSGGRSDTLIVSLAPACFIGCGGI